MNKNKQIKIKMKELRVEVPQGYEIDKENSTFEHIKFKPIKNIKTTEDLIETGGRMAGYWINDDAEVCKTYNVCYAENSKDVFLSEKEAKSALAMAQISQLMPYYGGAITDEEWDREDVVMFYTIKRIGSKICKGRSITAYYYLAFHTEKQRNSFLENNEQLVKDYLMLD